MNQKGQILHLKQWSRSAFLALLFFLLAVADVFSEAEVAYKKIVINKGC